MVSMLSLVRSLAAVSRGGNLARSQPWPQEPSAAVSATAGDGARKKESFGSFEPKQITREIRESEPPPDCEGSLN
jgi:hypothetical protein